MQWLNQIPMFRPFLALFVGVILGFYWHFDNWILLVFAGVFSIVGFITMYGKNHRLSRIAVSGICFFVALLFVGSYNYSSQKDIDLLPDGYYTYRAIVKKVITQKEDYTRAYIEIRDVENVVLKQPYYVLASIYHQELLPEDEIYASSSIKAISPPHNTGQFDMKSYYAYKWVFQTTSIYPNNFIKSENFSKISVLRWSFLASKWCSSVFKKYLPERSASTMQALLLGKKDGVNEDMKKVYMRAGVMHVLAVSGMHVGILYVGMLLLFRRFYKKRKWLSIIPILLIWVFAFVTGAGPAVLRAALMITFVDVGKKLNERADSINLLFVAGFLLLIFQPFLVWDIGFQLSFAAMLGILYLMKPIHNMLYVKKKWVDNFIWTPSALSLSAQLGTTPLSFFYFGNFPVLFLLTNIIILMPVTIAMYLGILLLISSAILPYGLNILIGKLLDAILYYGFDLPLQWIVTLPSAYVDKIYLLPWQVAVLMLSILFFGIWLYHLKKGKYLVLSLSFLVVSFLGGVYREFQNSQLIKINILHVPGSHAVAVNNYIWSGNENAYSLISDNEFHLGGYLRVGGWKVWTAFPPDFVQSDSNLLIVGDKSIYFLNQNLNEFDNTHKIEVGYLVLGDNFFLDVKKLKEIFDFRYLVLDGKLPYSKYMLFKRLLEKESIDFMDTREDGALEILL